MPGVTGPRATVEANNFSNNLKRQTLAEQLADTLKEAILAGRWAAGEALPTEPELAAQFGVSRAVVRDGTRMLAARGLVEAQHGRGVFVTGSPVAAFSDALLLALRRAGATAWDVERFEQMVLPEVQAEAARQATDEKWLRSAGWRRFTTSPLPKSHGIVGAAATCRRPSAHKLWPPSAPSTGPSSPRPTTRCGRCWPSRC